MQAIFIVLFLIWVYLLWVLHRAELYFFKFCVGSVGLFSFLMIWLQPLLTWPLTKAVAAVAGIFGRSSGMFDAYYQYAILFITRDASSISFYIDYECSGIVEMLAFTCMLWFFPLYPVLEKAAITLVGLVWIFFANILRIFCICMLIYYFGNNIFYFAHTIFGRIIFYALSVVLYFFVFTRSQILRQKVGGFSYGQSSQ